jgi:RNA polymerase sigma-70 factor (ECF subfamily)
MLDMYQVETKKSSPNEFDWVDRHADYLYRFALSRLHNESTAEDLVQETLLAALRSSENFANLSSERTWLTGILKHKIYDHFRCIYRKTAHENNHLNKEFFDTAGHWKTDHQSTGWNADPLTLLEQKEFQEVLQKCLSTLPERLACVFTLSEIENLSGEEICRLLNISPNNFWITLHRARLCLRESLEQSWFNGKPDRSSNRISH